MPGLFYWRAFIKTAPISGTIMTETFSKSRQQAEIAFGNTQTQFFARNNAVEELDSLTQAREEKTLRLREARIAKEQKDRASVTEALLKKRSKKV